MPLYMTGAQIGLTSLPGLQFHPSASYSGCKLCGKVFQSNLDRKLFALLNEPIKDDQLIERVKVQADYLRQMWREEHSKTHPEEEHRSLKLSGEFCTPEAALKLVPLGITPLQHEGEVAAAMLEAPRAPLDDVEGT